MQSKIIKHFGGHCANPHLVTFVRYKEGPKAKNAESFINNPVGKATDWCRKYSRDWFLVKESHEDGTPHIHAICNIDEVKPMMSKFKFARVHILKMEPKVPATENTSQGAGQRPEFVAEGPGPTHCCVNCDYNATLEDSIFGVNKSKRCLNKRIENSVSKILECSSFYLSKQFYCETLERYKDYNCSCKKC